MRKLIVGVVALGLVGAGALVAVAGTAVHRSPVDCSDAVWKTSSVSTTSTTWEAVPGFTLDPVAIFPVAIDVSAQVSGAQVQFRIVTTNVGGQTAVSKPGPAQFDPGANGANSFAYRWVDRNRVAAPHALDVELQWRSVSGTQVSLLKGVMTATYQTDGCEGRS